MLKFTGPIWNTNKEFFINISKYSYLDGIKSVSLENDQEVYKMNMNQLNKEELKRKLLHSKLNESKE